MARGRSGGRPTVESCLTITMQALKKHGALDGSRPAGWFSWTYPAIGTMIPERLIGRLAYEVETAGHEGLLRITSIVRADPMGNLIETSGHVVRLEATVPPFGGLRWWFACPISGQLVSKIHLPRGAHRFGSQKAYRLGYAS